MMEEIRIVVIDDHPLFREGVVKTLSLEPDFHVIGEAANGEDGLELVFEFKPDVAVVDINLPNINGLQLTQKITSAKLKTRVVLVTAYDDDEQKVHALKAGGSAYCTKGVEPERLILVVRDVYHGSYVINDIRYDRQGILEWLSGQVDDARRPYGDPGDPYQPLSVREMEVLTHIVKGRSNKEIAARLGISHQTVKNHVTSIFRKLGVDDRTQAALYALRRGWIRLYRDEDE